MLRVLTWFWPKRLFTRTLLLVMSIMLLSYVAAVILFASFFKRISIESTLIYVSREIKSVVIAYEHLPAERFKRYLQALAKKNQYPLRAVNSRLGTPGFEINTPIHQKLLQLINAPVKLRYQKWGEQVTVWLRTPRYWLGIPVTQTKQKFGPNLLAQIMVIIFLSLTGVLWIAFRLKRPFKRLTQAANQVSEGNLPEPLPVSGPKEVKQLTQTFNAMCADLAKLEQDRHLMLAGISHDLRTPLSRLRMAIGLLEQSIEPELRQGMELDLEDIDAIVGQFIAYVDQDSAHQIERIYLKEFLQQLCERYSVHPVLEVDSACCVLFKLVTLKRLMRNLIENAIHYGAPPIIIRATQADGRLTLCVEDHGEGIAPEHRAALCQPFTRHDQARANVKGTGLGLAIVKKIAQSNQLKMQMDNCTDGGLRVCLSNFSAC